MPQAPFTSHNLQAQFSVRTVSPSGLTAQDVQAWLELEARATEPNAYLSPHFVLPAARYLDPHSPPTLFLTERLVAGQRELVGVAALRRSAATRRFPLTHWVAYQSQHSYLSGLLLDRRCPEPALQALLNHVRLRTDQHGIELPQIWADGALAQSLARGAAPGSDMPRTAEPVQRAILRTADAGEPMLRGPLAKRMKDLNRRMRRLGELGEVRWRYHREGGVPDSVVETFLALEHAGWKGQEGSSLRSDPAAEAFFKSMVAGFASQNRALFMELTLNGEAIASISNLIAGGVGFGFKIGWHPEFKAYSPGVLNEVELIRHAPTAFADISYFDSGSGADSYINDLWPSRRPMCPATLACAPLARLVTDTASSARSLKRRLKVSPMHAAAMHVAKPEWMAMANESLSSLAFLL